MGQIIIETPFAENYNVVMHDGDEVHIVLDALEKFDTTFVKTNGSRHNQSKRNGSMRETGENLDLPTTADLIAMDKGKIYTREELQRIESGERGLKALDRAEEYGAFED